MKNNKKILKFLAMHLILAILVMGCQKSDLSNLKEDDVCNYSEEPDADGNIVIKNFTGFRLALIVKDEVLKIIPAYKSDFLVNIENASQGAVDLYLKKVTGECSIESGVFKNWYVPLSADNSIIKRVTWHVEDKGQTTVGTLTFSYPGGTDYWCEVYEGNRQGSHLMTLNPGWQYEQRIGVEYGTYNLLYKYMDSSTEIGWIEKEVISGVEEDIYVVLNAQRPNRYIVVPHYNTGLVELGSIRVRNSRSAPITIWVETPEGEVMLIENSAWTDGERINLSTIAAGETMKYDLYAGTYRFFARRFSDNSLVGQIDIAITNGNQEYWEVLP